MSLDFCLKKPEPEIRYEECPHCCGKGRVPVDGAAYDSFNITHNCGNMAVWAGIYMALWYPEEIEAKKAKDIIPLLEAGVKRMEDNPEECANREAKNGWGTYDAFLPWVRKVLKACKEHPEAEIEVSR